MVAQPWLDHLGEQTPRIEVIPPGEEHPKWQEVIEFIAALGIALDPWQLRVLWASLLRKDGLWAAFAIGLCAPRQNGKNGILEVRELLGPLVLGEKFVIHSAHRADTSEIGFRRLEDLIDANEWLSGMVKHIWRRNGHESIEFKGGGKIRFRTRTRSGGRGFSGSPVILDEAMFLGEDSMAALHPVMTAQPDPQVWYTGSAVDQFTMDEGVVFARIRERALSKDPKRLAYFEWSLDAERPELVDQAQAEDPQVWAKTNPALGIRITSDYIREELKALDPRTFAVERLGVGDWPDTTGTRTVIPLELWHKLADSDSQIDGPPTFAFDIRPDRSRGVIVVVGRRKDGHLHIEVIDNKDGTGWMLGRLEELERKHRPLGIVCDGVGPAASLVPELEQRNVDVTVLTTPQVGEACGMLYDATMQERVRHLGAPDLVNAIKGAQQRTLGDRWAWSRRNSTSDISPLVAVTLGVWLVVTTEQIQIMPRFG